MYKSDYSDFKNLSVGTFRDFENEPVQTFRDPKNAASTSGWWSRLG